MTAADMPWASDANCAGLDPDLFFPADGESAAAAKAVCRGCVVRVECLSFAVAHGERHGVWGGLTPRERRPLRRLAVAR